LGIKIGGSCSWRAAGPAAPTVGAGGTPYPCKHGSFPPFRGKQPCGRPRKGADGFHRLALHAALIFPIGVWDGLAFGEPLRRRWRMVGNNDVLRKRLVLYRKPRPIDGTNPSDPNGVGAGPRPALSGLRFSYVQEHLPLADGFLRLSASD
jgi:hypothetical protein